MLKLFGEQGYSLSSMFGKAKAMISDNSIDEAIPVLNKIINNNLSNREIAQRLLSKIEN